jgi:hypothetical protein
MQDKMKSILLYCAALLILLTQLQACSKKSSSSPSTAANSCKLTGINAVGGNAVETCSVTYNSDGNVIKMTTSGYTNGDVVIDSVVVNSDGLMLSDLESNIFDTSLTTYTYTGTEVASSIFQQAGHTPSATTFTFSNGDLTGTGSTDTITYNDKPSAPGDYFQIIQLLNYAAPYIKTAHQCTSYTSNGVTSNFTYAYDSTGKITQLVLTGLSNGTFNYSYDCK